MAREMALAGVKPEELKPAEKIQAPKTPRGKWENFWYHYKWHTIGGVFGVFVLGVMLFQLFVKDPPDYQVVVVTEAALFDTTIEALEQELASYGRDIDGDGKVEVEIQNCYLANPGTQEYFTNQQAIQSRIFAGDVMLFLWEPQYYEEFITNVNNATEGEITFFIKLPFQAEGLVEEGHLWNWADSGHREEGTQLTEVPKELYFGVRTGDSTVPEQMKMREEALELLEAFATGKKGK